MNRRIYSLLTLCLVGLMALPSLPAHSATDKLNQVPPLHVDGKWLKDDKGNKVVLHGVMDTPSPYFNNYRWGGSANDASVSACINYFNKIFDGIANPELGTYCNVFRLHLDPCWTNDNASHYSDKTGDGEADIQHFSRARLTKYLRTVYWPIMQKALRHGMYVVVRPPGVCPGSINVGGVYNQYLLDVWDIVSKNDSIRKYAGQISLELANEPVAMFDADGKNQNSGQVMHDFFQPVVDKIRSNGFSGIIWIPGATWQQDYRGYASHPIEGPNIGYAVHDYVGWYSTSESSYDHQRGIESFHNSVPVVDTNPIIITEVDWSPENASTGHRNESGEWVNGNYGSWATGSTSKWGLAYKAMLDYYGNISMTLSGTHTYIDVDKWINNKILEPAYLDAMRADGYADAYEASSGACWQWYKEYAEVNHPYRAWSRQWTADQGNGKYKNPILNADFPDPDVIRVGDTFYMVSTTMFHFPGATLLKSKDLVNWEYCANPLQRIADSDAYNLQQGLNHYAGGQWAASLSYSQGKFYIYFIAYAANGQNDGKNVLLTATDPEGPWTMEYFDHHYYDSGWLFDEGEGGDGFVYVACGIGDIYVAKLNRSTLKEISSTKVLSLGNGLEGSHMYHIGDYYYIYATYGGTEGSQTIFRSKSPLGPYEEHEGRVFEKQHIHQGALVDTPDGEWWTILFKDAGAIGRIPYLEPVKWTDGWPVVGKSGKDVSLNGASYAKPAIQGAHPFTYLPSNDNFTSPQLGLQWEWNHNPVDAGWSLFEHPGCLRLHTVSVTDDLRQAQNSLTQRIQGYTPEGSQQAKVKDSYGTVKMYVGGMMDGDVAGISVFQDPFSFISVKQVDGKRFLYGERHYFDAADSSMDKVVDTDIELPSDTIYLRATANFGTNKCKYFYSFDNVTYHTFPLDMDMRFILSVFVGQRFYLFNYATKQTGGYVDIDWFTTEPTFSEEMFYSPEMLQTYTEEDLTMADLALSKDAITLMPGTRTSIEVICTAVSGLQTNVASACRYEVANPHVATIDGGVIRALEDGSTTATISYTDAMGNNRQLDFRLTVTTFPLTADAFNPSIYSTGKYNEKTQSLTTGQYGFGGWEYPGGLDLSAHKYLVVKLKGRASCGPSFRLFDENNYWSSPHMTDFGNATSIRINLTTAKRDDGKKLDPKHIYIAGFWSYGGSAIQIKEIFLSDDGVHPIVAGLENILLPNDTPAEVYDLQGRSVPDGANRLQDGTLPRGIWIVNGKKIMVK